FENVGGDVLEAVIPRLNPRARVPICGSIAHYNETPETRRAHPMQRLQEEGLKVLGKDGNTEGYTFFGFSNLATRHPQAEEALADLSGWIKAGRLKYRESITEGLDSAVDAFIGMLGGRNFGKTMVRVSA
ncbi:MAG: NADP-dependent oxidoreductase, partial [Pseudomonadales bacterium]|nr:NADP-dependent oxidoreductase [Pseudomonadales bacterium]